MTVFVANGDRMLTGKHFYRCITFTVIVQVLLAKTLSNLRNCWKSIRKGPFVTELLYNSSSSLPFPNRKHHFEAVMHFSFQRG